MKHVLLMLIFLALSGCDPVECADQIVKNGTETDLTLFRISSMSNIGDTTFIASNSQSSISKRNCAKGGVVLSYSAYDSVYITNSNNNILKIYHPDDTGKNIFNVDDRNSWKVENIGKDEKKYVFEITDDDLN